MTRVSGVFVGWQLSMVTVLLLAGVGSCAPPPRVVQVGGKEVPVTQAAEDDLEEAKKALEAGRLEEADARLRRVLADYADAGQLPDALLLSAKLRAREGNWPETLAAAQRLLVEFPGHAGSDTAKMLLGWAQFETGAVRDAYETLRTVYPSIEDAGDRAATGKRLAHAAEQLGLAVDLVRWQAALYAGAEPAEQERIRASVAEFIDGRLGFLDARKLYETLVDEQPDHFALPLLTYKLARIFAHVREFQQSREWLEQLLQKYPDSPFAAPARADLERLANRFTVEPAKLGVLLPLSGTGGMYGQRMLDAVNLAFSGTTGITLVVRDTKGTEADAVRAVEELVYQEHVIGVLGPAFSDEALAAARKAEELGLPMLSLSFVAGLPEVGPFVFRNCLTYGQQARAVARYAVETLGYKRFALLYPNIRYGVELLNEFWDEVELRGGEIVGAERFEHDETDFGPQVKRLVGRFYVAARNEYQNCKWQAKQITSAYRRTRALEQCAEDVTPVVDFDAIFVPAYPKSVGYIAPALVFENIMLTQDPEELNRLRQATGLLNAKPVRLLGANGWNSDEVARRAGRHVEDAVFVDGFFASSERKEVRDFVRAYSQALERTPSLVEAQAFDSANVLEHVLLTAKPKTREELRAALAAVKGFPGVTGSTTFDERGEAQKPLFFLTIKEGIIREVGVPETRPQG